jgi:hypothetical protein
MGTSIKESALLDAAARVSSATVGASRGPGGYRSVDGEWEKLRGKLARALVSDPDLVTYFAYLASNRACALAQKAAAQLCSMAVSVEGWKYAQVEAKPPTQLQKTLATVTTRDTFSAADASRLSTEVNTYIAAELIPKITKGGRLQTRGTEAYSDYRKTRDELIVTWKKLRQALAASSGTRFFTEAPLRNVALSVPLAALDATASLLDQAKLTDFTVQLAAAGAAVAAMGRRVGLKTRLCTGPTEFPGEVTVNATIESGTVAEITMVPAPALLGIKPGDSVVSTDGKTATVSAVGDAGITLSASTITSISEGVSVFSAAYLQWETFALALDAPYAEMPSEAQLLSEVRRKESPSAARIRGLMEFLCRAAAILDSVSSDASAALTRVGGEQYAYPGVPVATLLREFSPTFDAKTKQAGNRLLSELESGGFDYAVELLYRGEVDLLMLLNASDVSRSGRLDSAVAALSTYSGGARGVG